MDENKNCVIIQQFLGEIYYNNIYDYELYKALIRILETIQSKNQGISISYPNFVNALSKKMINLVDNNDTISYKSIADIIITQINSLHRYTPDTKILDVKLFKFKILYIDFKPVDIFIEIETDEDTNEQFINRFILNDKYASTDLFTLINIKNSEKFTTCLDFNISDRGFNYVVNKIKEITDSLNGQNKKRWKRHIIKKIEICKKERIKLWLVIK